MVKNYKTYLNEGKEIKVFNDIRTKEIDGELWLSKEDVLSMFRLIIRINQDKKPSYVRIIHILKDKFYNIGGRKIKGGDPYGEEDWDD
jgi:hypothetical protein